MNELSKAELGVIEHRAMAAFGVTPLPWTPFLETRSGTGGCSFVQCGQTDADYEVYFDVRVGNERCGRRTPAGRRQRRGP